MNAREGFGGRADEEVLHQRDQRPGGDALVGGYIQAIYPFPDKAAVVCNEEGKNLGLPFNRPLFDENDLPYDIICGTFFVAGLGVEDFVSLTEEQIRRYKEHYDRVMVLTAAKETTPQHKPPHPHKYRRGVER